MADELYCLQNECKHERKDKRGGRQLTMIQCIHCMCWYHNECVNIQKDEVVGSFACLDCRLAPANVAKILEVAFEMKRTIDDIKADNDLTRKTLDDIKNECLSLKQENKELREKLTRLQTMTVEAASPSLLIGDSLINDFDEKKLDNISVKPLGGIKVAELKPRIEQAKSCRKIILCVGTNDCCDPNFDGEQITEDYKELVDAAKTKVIDSNNVIISSVPPRTDSVQHQENVEKLNAGLCVMARDTGVTFINNDDTFKLGDGSPNDGYLLDDGVHLSNRGSNRLARNLHLTTDPKMNVCKEKKSKKVKPQVEKQKKQDAQDSRKEEAWQTVRRGRQRSTRTTQDDRGSKQDQWNQRNCRYCGERNHSAQTCRHGQEITCHYCGLVGHKEKFCTA